MFGNNENVKDVAWENVENNKGGTINFRRKKNKMRMVLKAVSVILIAAVSGAVTSLYIVNKRYPQMPDVTQTKNLSDKKIAASANEEHTNNVITKVADSVGPAVVGISGNIQNSPKSVNKSMGSGVIFDANGYIVTSYNNIQGAGEINVKLANYGKELKAQIVGGDVTSDLAVIKINAKNLPVIKFGDSSKVRVGDLAIAIGNSVDEEFTGYVTAGIISSLNRKVKGVNSYYRILQTDADINPANSGGALCNEQGEVIGINSIKIGKNRSKEIEGVGFAVPSNEAKEILNQIVKYGSCVKPSIGIRGKHVVLDNKSNVKGIYVQEVAKKSGAEVAGIRPTDILLEIDNQKLNEYKDFTQIIEKHKIGDSIKCKVWRSGNTMDVNVVIGDDAKER
ncbi:S1C family serine protease [Clostridium brassicae]|uniref:Trypsin-like peptidase domain-containing protein n=1 Tax=Clostridium brassicae TaxID=2999072 RepID=A0ABT4DDD2_9CLOT|nr:trypsin-like peptidase domain-containing protein [Clostridium brassicae]MCY6960326.1 trypsin-like peptidase domain-containing protein [Clostridium brassicae]